MDRVVGGWDDAVILETTAVCPDTGAHTTSRDYEIYPVGHGRARSRRDDGTRCTNLLVVFQGWFQNIMSSHGHQLSPFPASFFHVYPF